MGMSASQARFLQLTARKSDTEYQAQQISQQRLALADKLSAVSQDYNDKISNKKLMFTYADSTTHQVDISYANYKNYMNQQLEGLQSSQKKLYLVSTSGKIVVKNEDEMNKIIEDARTYTKVSDVDAAKKAVEAGTANSAQTNLANIDWSQKALVTKTEEGVDVQYYVQEEPFDPEDFIFVDNLDDVALFQDSIQNGVYFFATLERDEVTQEQKLNAQSWETVADAAITDVYDESDDAQAEAEYETESTRLEKIDKQLQMELDKLETTRKALETEMEAVKDVIKDNTEKSFKTFG